MRQIRDEQQPVSAGLSWILCDPALLSGCRGHGGSARSVEEVHMLGKTVSLPAAWPDAPGVELPLTDPLAHKVRKYRGRKARFRRAPAVALRRNSATREKLRPAGFLASF